MRQKNIFSIIFYILPSLSFAAISPEDLKAKEFIREEIIDIPYLENQKSITEPNHIEIEEAVNIENEEEGIVLENNLNEEIKEEIIKEVAFNEPIEKTLEDLNIPEVLSSSLEDSFIPQDHPFLINTTFGYDLEKAVGKYFLEINGSETLKKDRKLDFLVKLPFFQLADQNTTTIKPDKFNFNFSDPAFQITLGDSKYNLTPLTIADYEGRGAFFRLNGQDNLGLKMIYLLSEPTEDDYPSDNIGASISLIPDSFIKLSTNFLFTKFNEEPRRAQNNYTYSLSTNLTPNESTNLDFEAAISNKFLKRNAAIFAALYGDISENLTYDFKWKIANPDFITEKTNQITLDGNVNLDLKKFIISASHKLEKNNLEKSNFFEKAKREKSSTLKFSYPFFKKFDLDLSFFKKAGRNALTLDGHKLKAVSLETSIPIKKYSIKNVLEFGKYKSQIENFESRNWQSAELHFSFTPQENNSISVYSKIGNIILDDVFTLSNIFGSKISYKRSDNLDLSIAYEYSMNTRKSSALLENTKMKWNRNHFKQELTYTLPNEHRITLTSHLNKPLKIKKEKAFLLTYTIPFNAPKISSGISNLKDRFF